MKKYKSVDRAWKLRKYPIVEVATHISFYVIRFTLFLVSRALYFKVVLKTPMGRSSANNYIVNYTFSLFLLFFVLYNIFTENIYGYYLAVVVMIHNFILMFAIVTATHFDNETPNLYWFLSIGLSSTYIVEACISMVLIHKKRAENNKALFQRLGADPKINNMYSIRKKLQTLSIINLFIPIVTVQKLYLIPTQFGLKLESATVIILFITIVQHLFVYANFYQEDLWQRKIAIAITIIKVGLSIGLIIVTALRYAYILRKAGDVRFIVYADLLLITLVFLYYLWMDMRNFGKGLKKHILFRTRKLTL